MEPVHEGQGPLGSRVLRYSEYFLLAVGFACVLWVAGVYLRTALYESYQSFALTERVEGRRPSVLVYLEHSVGMRTSRNAAPEISSEEALALKNGAVPKVFRAPVLRSVIGRVEIPRLDVSAIVREGDDHQTLALSAGHIPTTALPGEKGNVAIAAHRDTFFRGVRNIRKGDRIRMVTENGTFEYSVDSLKIVSPMEVEVLNPSTYPTMTLVTCYPFNYIGSAPKRFIVRARQVYSEAGNTRVQQGS